MMNVANPEEAFRLSFIPNDGVGLAREEFIISNYIKVHPLALVDYAKIDNPEVKANIDKLTAGYDDKPQFFVDKLAQGVAMIAAAFYPKDVIVRLSDFKTNEYANLIGGHPYEPVEENPMLGFRGASRYYNERYRAGFALECRAMKKVRDEMGLTNVKLMVPFCRTVEEGRKVIAEMEKHGLRRGEAGLEVYVMCEIPSNVILAEEFAEIFDGFSIGSNDLTQLILGVDRDSEIVAEIFDERNPAVKKMIAQVIAVARAKNRKIGICGQAPSDYPEFAQFLVEQKIDSISLNPDTVIKTSMAILEKERELPETKKARKRMKTITKLMMIALAVGLLGVPDVLAQRNYDPKTVETVQGKVLSVEKITGAQGRGYGIHLTLQTDKETLPVRLGPAWYIDEQTPRIETNDTVTVTGSRVTIGEKPAIIAAQIKKGNDILKLRDENGIPAWRGAARGSR